MEHRGRPVPSSLLGCREPLCAAAPLGAGSCEMGMLEEPVGQMGLVERGLACKNHWSRDDGFKGSWWS